MESGGYLDQDWATQIHLNYLDFVYQTIDKWRRGQNLSAEENGLILKLTQDGAM